MPARHPRPRLHPAPGAPPPPWFDSASDDGPSFSRDQLVRPTQGRYVAGVCAAIGRATNTDPVLWRVLIVVLGLFGGAGVLIYLIGWLGIRGENDAVSPIESLLGRGRSGMQPLTVVLLAIAAVASFVFIVHDGFRAFLLGAAAIVGIALLMKRNGGRSVSAPAPGAATEPPQFPFGRSGPDPTSAFGRTSTDPTSAFAAAGTPAGTPAPGAPAAEQMTAPAAPTYPPQFTPPPASDYRPPFAPHGPYANRGFETPPPAPKPPKRKRERSKLGRITFFAVVMVLGVLAVIDMAGATIPVAGYFAAALATIGLGLVVGAWFGRARGLIALAIIAALGLGASTAVNRGGEVINHRYQPAALAQVQDRYNFSIGNVTLDLRGVDFSGQTQDTTIAMKAGFVRVLLPPDVDTTATVAMQNGRAALFGTEYSNASATKTDLGADGAGGGTLHLTLNVDNGNVEVLR